MNNVPRDEVIKILQRGIYTVAFTKVNGEHRNMRCTLKPDLIPHDDTQSETQKEPRKVNEEVIAAFDLDKNEWRSFRVDKLISILQE